LVLKDLGALGSPKPSRKQTRKVLRQLGATSVKSTVLSLLAL
jgi:hypothetical protein